MTKVGRSLLALTPGCVNATRRKGSRIPMPALHHLAGTPQPGTGLDAVRARAEAPDPQNAAPFGAHLSVAVL